MDPNIRLINDENTEESVKLAQFAFQFELNKEDYEVVYKRFQSEQIWGYFVGEQLAAQMMILSLNTWVNGKSFPMAGIGSVATWPEYRRHGMVKKLLIHALHTMKEAGQTLSCLHPFEFPFYRKFGWETYAELKKYEIPKELILNQFTSSGQMKRTSDWRLLDELYLVYSRQFNGTLFRSEIWWTRQIMAGKSIAAVFYNESGKATGYIIYKVKDRILNVDELVFLDEAARIGLWKFIADHDSMMDKIILKAPANDQLAFILASPRIKQEIVPYFMARIVDLVAFLEKFSVTQGLDKQKMELHIRDEYAPWNNGIFLVKWSSSGKAKVKQIEAGDRKENKDTAAIACDIGTLTTMFMSYQRPALLHALGRLQANDATIELLEQLIPHRTTYLMDFF